jgi:hypothetical protein
MKKLLLIIFVLLALILGTAYYGYTVYTKNILTEASVESLLTDFDTAVADITIEGVQEETIAEIALAVAPVAPPLTLVELDQTLLELTSFSNSDTAVFGATITDL